ncbi:MAG: SurA N-terminal domain-containing protein [Bacteroidia bacterium]|nr:SurA N-terminal domain-containing protein [Bacteroidia bacterium]
MAGVIQKIRDKAGIVVGLIGVSLLLFILTDLLQSNAFIQELIWGRSDVLARVAGEEIRYNEYETLYERALRNQKTDPGDPFAEEQLKNAVWQQLIATRLYRHEIQALNLGVSDEELYEMFVSDNPHPVILQVFSEGGRPYDKQQIQRILAQASNNPQFAQQLKEFEDYIIEVRLREKYDALLKACGYVPAPLADYQNKLDNTAFTFQYLAINYSSVADSLVPISERDIERYYKQHREEFRQAEPERILRYLAVYKDPSSEDSAATLNTMKELREAFQRTTEDSAFASANSDSPVEFTYKRWYELPKELQDSIRTIGQVIGPYPAEKGYALTKVNDIQQDSLPAYKFRHIFFSKEKDSVSAKRRADSLLRVLRSNNFAEAVSKFSEDWQTKYSSGEVGWYTADGRFGRDFYEKLQKVPIGKIYGVLTSDLGYHIVEVQEREMRRVRLATLKREILPSSRTLSVLRQKAQQVAREASKGIEEAAQKAGFSFRISPSLRPSASFLPGIIGGKDIIQWAFTHKAGEYSGVMEAQNAYVVAQIISASDPPYRDWQTVRDQLEPKVRNQQKALYIRKKLEGKASGLEAMRAAYGPGAYVSRADNVQYSAMAAPGIGIEPKVIGIVAALQPNQVSALIEGTNGMYALQLIERREPPASDPQAPRTQSQLQSTTQANLLYNRLQEALKERLEVEDYRYKFGF